MDFPLFCSLIFRVLMILWPISYSSTANDDKFCGTIDFPLNPLISESRTHRYFGRLTIRLSVFYDRALLNKYNNNREQVEEFIYRTIHSVSLSYRQSSIRKIADFSIHIKKIGLYDAKINPQANGNMYRAEFCQFVKRSIHFGTSLAASVLLTGHNFRFQYSNSSTTQGLAFLDVACDWSQRRWGGPDPCTLVEGRHFLSTYILAHELGHMLGLNHDENLKCGHQHIMSESTGDGKTQWSKCSLNQLVSFLTTLKQSWNWCLAPDDEQWDVPSKFRSTSTDFQCQTALGPKFLEYSPWNRKTNICHRIECTDNAFVIPIHPAIENTSCGRRKSCREGQCTPY